MIKQLLAASSKRIIGVALLTLSIVTLQAQVKKAPVDYVNPYMGNISQMLVPTYPTVHLPWSMMRVRPERGSYTDVNVNGLPVFTVGHRGSTTFHLSATQGQKIDRVITTDYDNEIVRPYYYATDIDRQRVHAELTPSHHSAIYRFSFTPGAGPAKLVLSADDGQLHTRGRQVSGYQNTWGGVRVYIWGELSAMPADSSRMDHGRDAGVVLTFAPEEHQVLLRYGVSFISIGQARQNVQTEISDFDFNRVETQGRAIWNQELSRIEVEGGSDDDMTVFYTSLYRCYERPVCISEGGRHYSPSDHKVHADAGGRPYYTDDWLWDTYRAAHPLRLLINPEQETDIINSFIEAGSLTQEKYFPNFPVPEGDRRSMNCNHGIAVLADAWAKGLHGFDLAKAYELCQSSLERKTLLPWESHRQGHLDSLYRQLGYMPALRPGDAETYQGVNGFEKRQSVAVTLGTSYDEWCMSRLAQALGRKADADLYLKRSYNYRNLFNPATSFFHPKDENGQFVEPFDYRFSGGIGGRDYYDENNGWTYRWDVQHNVADLVALMGGPEPFCQNLDRTFTEWLGKNRYEFYAQFPDHTANVGQFSMGNEPSLHIPYLYNYAGKPWLTQRRVRQLVHEWFRNDLQGVPGDEDGGGLSAFVVFSMMGFYPVTPGMPSYNVGSPFFRRVTIHLPKGHTFVIDAPECSQQNKYITSAALNGQPLTKPWFNHRDISAGGTLKLTMSSKHNASWGAAPGDVPPSQGATN